MNHSFRIYTTNIETTFGLLQSKFGLLQSKNLWRFWKFQISIDLIGGTKRQHAGVYDYKLGIYGKTIDRKLNQKRRKIQLNGSMA